jgi:hypothetical protein
MSDDLRLAIDEAKARLPMPELLDRLGIPRKANGTPKRNPLREDDKNPSFSVFREGALWFWKDHGTGKSGDEIGLLEAFENLTRADAIRRYLALAGVAEQGTAAPPAPAKKGTAKAPPPSATPAKREPALDWHALVAALDDEQLAKLAKWRGLSIEFCRWLREAGLVGSHKKRICFPVHDDAGNVIAAHIRLGAPVKWIFESRGKGTRPLVIGPRECDRLLVAESQWDAFAAMDRLGWHREPPAGFAVCITRGASNGRLAAAAGVPRARECIALVQADDAGEKWLAAVAAAFNGPVRVIRPPDGAKDINEAVLAVPGLDVHALFAAAAPYSKQTSASGTPPTSSSPPPAAAADDLDAIAEREGLHWLEGSDKFFRLSPDGSRFLQVGVADLRRRFKRDGISSRPAEGETCSKMDRLLCEVQDKRIVDWSGNVAGFDAGVYPMHGRTVLVKESPKVPVPAPGDCSFIMEFLRSRLDVPEFGSRQLFSFMAWAKFAFAALASGSRQPGPALALCGPSDCGKSRIQHNLITPLLGGRVALPDEYFMGTTQHNAELVGAEHWLIEDVNTALDSKARTFFGEKIKKAVVGDILRGRGMYQEAMTLDSWHRVTISMNDNPERMRVLPPISSDLRDKFLILKVQGGPWPCSMESPEDRAGFRDRILAEIPAFAYYLRNFDVPDDCRSRRYGVKAWQHPEIVAILNDGEPEAVLLCLCDEMLFTGERKPWRGTASALERELTEDGSACVAQAKKLFKSATSCGILLGKLADKYPLRIQNARKGSSRDWIIEPPPEG